jgi:hypothetical protein
MKSRYYAVSFKLALVGALSLSLAACNKDSSPSQRSNAIGVAAAGMPTNVSANGTYVRGNSANPIQCNINDANPSDQQSPYNIQSPCQVPSMVAQAQTNGTLPGQTGQGPQTQQQPQVGANGQPVIPGQIPTGNPPNVSADITPDGKIVKRNFRLVGGVGQEEITDTCHYLKFDTTDLHDDAADPSLNHKEVSRFLYPQYDRFEMFFDEKGNLSIAAQSVNGQAYSVRSNPIPYTLNAADQTIEVSAFNIAGPASTQFVQAEKAVAQQFGTNEDAIEKELYDLQGGTSPGPNSGPGTNQNSANPGFVLGPQATTNNPNGGYRSLPQTPLIETPATTALSIAGFTGKISTWVIQPQHITEIRIPEIPFQSKTFAQAQPDVCQGNGHGRYVDIHLQPTQ